MSPEALVLYSSECFYQTSAPSESLECKRRATENVGVCWFVWLPQTSQSRSQSSTLEQAAGPTQPKENKRPSGRVWVVPHWAAPGSEGSWPRTGDSARSQPLDPAVIPAPGRARGTGAMPCTGRSCEPRPPCPRSEPRQVPARASLHGRWVQGQHGPRPGFVLPLALCRRGGTGNPGRPRQPRLLLLLLLPHLLLLLLRSRAHDGGSRRSRGEQRRQQQHRYLQHGRGGEDEAPLPDLRRRWRWLHQQVATAGGGSLLAGSRPVLSPAPRPPALKLWASWSCRGSSAAAAGTGARGLQRGLGTQSFPGQRANTARSTSTSAGAERRRLLSRILSPRALGRWFLQVNTQKAARG